MPIAMFHISDEVQDKLAAEAQKLNISLDRHVKNSFEAFVFSTAPVIRLDKGTPEQLAELERLFLETPNPEGVIVVERTTANGSAAIPNVAAQEENPLDATVRRLAEWAMVRFSGHDPFTFSELIESFDLQPEGTEKATLASKFAGLVKRGNDGIVEAGKNSSKAKLYKIDQ